MDDPADPVVDALDGLADAYLMAEDAVKNPPRQPLPPSRMGDADALALLERRVSRLSLLCQAMWELLRERTEVTDKELSDKVLEVDLRDGHTDGRIAPQAAECPHCKRAVNGRRPTCMYCGVELPRRHLFEV